jgi:hypothetical protein
MRSFGTPQIPYRIAEKAALNREVLTLKNSVENRFLRLKVVSQAEATNYELSRLRGDGCKA